MRKAEPARATAATCGRWEHCMAEFHRINRKLDRIDTAVRGNGQPGIQTRIDRLERTALVRARLLWLIAGSTTALAVGAAWNWLFGA